MSASLPPLVIRPIEPGDAGLLTEGLQRLSRDSVYRRFLSPKPRLSSSELRYLTDVDGWYHHALVAVRADDPRAIVADGRWVRLADDPTTAEAAIVVGDCWQGRGIGRMLGLALADAARVRGVRRFTATMLASNVAAHRLMFAITDRLQAVPAGDGVDELTAELRLAA